MNMNLPLFLSDVGGSEIFLILLVVLLFFGSKGIPGIAKTMGKTMRQIRDASQEVQNEIRKSSNEMKSDFNLQNMMNDTVKEITDPLLEEGVKMDQMIQMPTEHSKPFGVNPNPPVPMDLPEDISAEENPVEEIKKDQ
jgi:sec-independent protein translocase protein TatA